jgi:hypothetical protein
LDRSLTGCSWKNPDRRRSVAWAQQPSEARIAEVEALRRLWIEVAGDPDRPIEEVVHKRRLGEPAPKRPG